METHQAGSAVEDRRERKKQVLDELSNPFLTLRKFCPVQHRLQVPAVSGTLSGIGRLMDKFISYDKQPVVINQIPALQESNHQDPSKGVETGGSSGKIPDSVHCLQEPGHQFLNKVPKARV